MKDDPKFRALLMRRERGELPPDKLWPDGNVPLDGIATICEWHRHDRITGKEWLNYLQEWLAGMEAQRLVGAGDL